jgi:hypothetical protein
LIGKGTLAMINMSNDGEITNKFRFGHISTNVVSEQNFILV